MKRYTRLLMTGCLSLLLSHSLIAYATDEENEAEAKKSYQWQNFSFEYPETGWKLEQLDNDKHTMNMRLTSNRDPQLGIILTLRNDMPELDDEYDENPAMASVAFGLPIALNLAEKQEDRVALTFSQINFDEHWELAARFQVSDAEGSGFQLVEAFHYFPEAEQAGVLGAVISRGQKGDVKEDAAYYNYIYQAYDIIQSLKVKAP